MNDEVSWQVELELEPGKLDPFRALTEEMVEATRGEAGALIYERFISEDVESIWVYERYADSAAAVVHLRTFAKQFAERFASMVTRKRFTVFGSPSDELRSILDGFDATYLGRFAGFSRSDQWYGSVLEAKSDP